MSHFYQAQKAMRQIRKAAVQRGSIAVLDIGSSKIACLVLRFDGPDLTAANDNFGELADQARYRIVGAATTKSRGVIAGEIKQVAETERAIRTVVQAAQKMANIRVDQVVVSFAGANPRSYGLTGTVSVAEEIVSSADLSRVMAACDLPDYGEMREVIHALPVNFSLDHQAGLSDPRGQIGQKLTTDLHLLTIDTRILKNILYCVERCDLELAGIASASYMSGLSSLVEDEKELGAAVIDLGGGTSSVSLFWKKHMVFSETIPMGGDNITRDISLGLQIHSAQAERIKNRFGGVVATGMDDRDEIELISDTGDWEHDRRSVSRSELIGIIRPRVEEILEGVRASLDAGAFESLPGQQIVLTGGASQLPGIDSLAARILGNNVRMGRPMRLKGLPQAASGAPFSSLVGLSQFAAAPQEEWWDFDLPVQSYPKRSLRRAVKWFRDNW